jgi:hypothetical protein
MRDFRPLLFFGSIGAAFFAVGVFLGAWVLAHWFATGETHPYTSFLTGSAVGLVLGVVLFVLALIADLLGRARAILEEILFMCKSAHYRMPGRVPLVPTAPLIPDDVAPVAVGQDFSAKCSPS